MALKHKEKKKLASRLNEKTIKFHDDKGKEIIKITRINSGNFLTEKWDEHKMAIQRKVEKRNKRIQLAVEKKRKAKNDKNKNAR